MRPNQQNKNRSRNRNGGRKHVNPLSRNYESNGPDVKVRGNAAHIAEKYTQLARDAQSSGDSVMAENYLQHAEHYYRIVMAAQPQPFRADGAQDAEDDYDPEDDIGNRFASRNPERQQHQNPQQNEPDSQPQSQPQSAARPQPAENAEGETAPVEAGEAEDGQPAEAASGDEAPRKRRQRRRRPAQFENDPASAPQPEVGDLPAFITAGGAAE
jgi:hypothetical protein